MSFQLTPNSSFLTPNYFYVPSSLHRFYLASTSASV
jgi:hypothetical protein